MQKNLNMKLTSQKILKYKFGYAFSPVYSVTYSVPIYVYKLERSGSPGFLGNPTQPRLVKPDNRTAR